MSAFEVFRGCLGQHRGSEGAPPFAKFYGVVYFGVHVRVAWVGEDRAAAESAGAELHAALKPTDNFSLGKQLRDEQPLYYNERYDFYALSRFEDVERASVDWKTYSSAKGTLTVSGAGIKTPTPDQTVAAGQTQLLVKAKGKRKRKLFNQGRCKVNVALTYTPAGGAARTQHAKFKLLKKL